MPLTSLLLILTSFFIPATSYPHYSAHYHLPNFDFLFRIFGLIAFILKKNSVNVLELNNITKHYKTVTALRNVSFSVPEGSVYGILGPNGSGKTTLLGILLDILKPSAGSFLLMGRSADAELRKQTGTLLETPNFYQIGR